MDYQNRVGGKTGTGGVASASESNRDRRERLRQLALETIDLQKDPYFMRNHLGSYECKLCLTLHNNEGSYLAHTQGKKHQSNLARRAAKDAKDSNLLPQLSAKSRVDVKKFVKIGRPGYRITKQLDPSNNQQSLLFQIDYPEIADHIIPKHRFMSAYEQKIEPPDRHWQYVLFAAEPYETIAFKVPSREVDKSEGKFWTLWNKDSKQFFLQFAFRLEGGQLPMMGANYANSQNFVSQNNQLNRLDRNFVDDKENDDQKMDDELNEFNQEMSEQIDEQIDEQMSDQMNDQLNDEINDNVNDDDQPTVVSNEEDASNDNYAKQQEILGQFENESYENGNDEDSNQQYAQDDEAYENDENIPQE